MRNGTNQTADSRADAGSHDGSERAPNAGAHEGPKYKPDARANGRTDKGTDEADGCANGCADQGTDAESHTRAFVAPNADALAGTERVPVREPNSLAIGDHASTNVAAQLQP